MGTFWIEAMERRLCLSAGTYDFGQVGNYNVKAVVEGPKSVMTFAMVGGGNGEVTVTDSGLDVTLEGTNSATTLTITAKGWHAQIHNLTDAGGSIGRVLAGHVDVSGDVSIAGSVGALQLGSLLGGNTVNIGSGVAGAEISLGTVTDTSLSSSTPFKTFTLNGWYDTDSIPDTVNIPWIGAMKVKADFQANLTTASIGSATVGGNWGGITMVTGNAGALKMSHLRGNLTVAGKSTGGISTKDYLFLGGLNFSPAGGVLHLAGTTHVKSAKESFMAVNATLYAALTSKTYSAEELLAYDMAGTSRTYNASARINRAPATGTSTESVEPAPTTIDGRDCWLVDNTDTATQTTTSTAFFTDGTGTYQTQFTTADPTGQQLQLDLGMLKFAPPMLGIGQANSASRHITGTLHLPPSITGTGSSIDAPVTGTASLATRILDHDSVSTPAGKFLAVKMQVTRSLDVLATAHVGLFVFQQKIHITQSDTLWTVPGIGIVQDVGVMVQQSRTLGLANHFSAQSILTKETRQLL